MGFLSPITNFPGSEKLAATAISLGARTTQFLEDGLKQLSELGISELLEESPLNSEEDQSANTVGLNVCRITEPVPIFNKAPGEKVVAGTGNASIVLGRDRNSSPASGYGGAGHTQCSSIDIVCGRGAAVNPRSGLYADPNFKVDAARIYVSQRSDIDEYLSLAPGSVGQSVARSAIGLKADNIRMASRQGIKIVTGVDQTNSLGAPIFSTKGIDLIAGNNDEDLQPITKGDNVIEAISELKENLSDLNGVVLKFITNQMIFNAGVQAHTHAPSFGMAPSIELQPIGITTATQIVSSIPTLWLNKVNMMTYDFNYLFPFGSKYICGYNRTN